MVTPEVFAKLYIKLPPLAHRVLDNEAQVRWNIAICDKYHLNGQKTKQYMMILASVLVQDIALKDVLKNFQDSLGLSPKETKELTIDVLGREFLPLAWLLGDVTSLIKEYGGDPMAYQAEAEKNYPEVYHPELAEKAEMSVEQSQSEKVADATEPTILRNIEDRLASSKGRAEVLLRLTALSQQIEDAVKANKISEKEGQDLMHSLDALSYAVNTQDLNPLETAAIKRRLKSIIAKLDAASA